MSLRGKAVGKLAKKGTLKKLGRKAAKGLSTLSGMRGRRGVFRHRRARGITARQFRTAQRVLKKIVKMYAKLPRRAAHRSATGSACRRGR